MASWSYFLLIIMFWHKNFCNVSSHVFDSMVLSLLSQISHESKSDRSNSSGQACTISYAYVHKYGVIILMSKFWSLTSNISCLEAKMFHGCILHFKWCSNMLCPCQFVAKKYLWTHVLSKVEKVPCRRYMDRHVHTNFCLIRQSLWLK